MRLSVVIPTHNPQAERLRRTLVGLRMQSLPSDQWETILVDNASTPALLSADWAKTGPGNLRLVRENTLGLSPARACGFRAATGDLVVLVDDDNVLAPDYLSNALRHFSADSGLGALGGIVRPEFATPPAAWVSSFHGLLALRDHGPVSLRADWRAPDRRSSYPRIAPIGAGLVVRRMQAIDYADALHRDPLRRSLDRTGHQLTSGGDNDLVMHVLEAGFSVGYEPDLCLTHLIPTARLQQAYLGKLNRAIARSWVRVLALHGMRPWRPIAPITVPSRQARAWWRTRAWRGPGEWVTWQGLCGTFEGQADLSRLPVPTVVQPRTESPS